MKISYINVFTQQYISLSDLARSKSLSNPDAVVRNWLRNKSTILFLISWESSFNPRFSSLNADFFLHRAGCSSFSLSPSKWVKHSLAKGIIVKVGRNGGTFAHRDIALKFAEWISAESLSAFQSLLDINDTVSTAPNPTNLRKISTRTSLQLASFITYAHKCSSMQYLTDSPQPQRLRNRTSPNSPSLNSTDMFICKPAREWLTDGKPRAPISKEQEMMFNIERLRQLKLQSSDSY